MALQGIGLSASVLVGVAKPNDAKYGPFLSVSIAISEIGSTMRYQGLTVGIIENGSLVEYWWKDGVGDNDLVEKTSGGGTAGGASNLDQVLLEGNVSERSIELISSTDFGSDKDYWLKMATTPNQYVTESYYFNKYNEFLITSTGTSTINSFSFTNASNSTNQYSDLVDSTPLFLFDAYRTSDSNLLSRNPNKVAYQNRDILEVRSADVSYMRIGPTTVRIGSPTGNRFEIDEYNRFFLSAGTVNLTATQGYYFPNLTYQNSPDRVMTYNEFTGQLGFTLLSNVSGGGTEYSFGNGLTTTTDANTGVVTVDSVVSGITQGAGILVSDDGNGLYTITNSGVRDLTAGSGISITNNSGNYTIAATGGGGGGGGIVFGDDVYALADYQTNTDSDYVFVYYNDTTNTWHKSQQGPIEYWDNPPNELDVGAYFANGQLRLTATLSQGGGEGGGGGVSDYIPQEYIGDLPWFQMVIYDASTQTMFSTDAPWSTLVVQEFTNTLIPVVMDVNANRKFYLSQSALVNDTFTTADGKTVVIQNNLVKSITIN